jgi:hypothetical protein
MDNKTAWSGLHRRLHYSLVGRMSSDPDGRPARGNSEYNLLLNKNDMIARIWHRWTTFRNATVYELLLRDEIFPSIENRNIKGYKKISLLKRDLTDEVEFITIMLFDNLNSVKDFAGTSECIEV